MTQVTLPIDPPFDLRPPRGLLTPRAFMLAVLRADEDVRRTYGIDDWADGYAEPGYNDPAEGVLFGNWNVQRQHDKTGQVVVFEDRRPARFSAIAEAAGYGVEWYDEWSTCHDCGKAVRTSPDSYGWRRSYAFIGECDLVCHECVKASPDDYVAELIKNPQQADTLDLDLTAFGFQPWNGTYENGWHPAQNDDPKTITAEIRQTHPGAEVVFQIPSVGQFDIRFTAWYRLLE